METNKGIIALSAIVTSLATGCAVFNAANGAISRAATRTADNEGSTGAIHDAHMDQMVFSRTEVPREGDAAIAEETTFRADEPIWGRAYLSRSFAQMLADQPDPHNHCGAPNRREIDVYATLGEGPELRLKAISPGEKTWGFYTTFQPYFDATPLVASQQIVLPNHRGQDGVDFLAALASLPNGTHPVTLRVRAGCGPGPSIDAVSGEFSVVVDDEARDTLARRIQLANARYTDVEELAQLEETAAQTFGGEVLDFRVLDPRWDVRVNALGVPVSRSLTSLTVYQTETTCTLIGSTIEQSHQGGGNYGAAVFVDPHDAKLGAMSVPCGIAETG